MPQPGKGMADVLVQLWPLLPMLGFPFLHFNSLMLSSTHRHVCSSPESVLTWWLEGKAVRGRASSLEKQYCAADGWPETTWSEVTCRADMLALPFLRNSRNLRYEDLTKTRFLQTHRLGAWLYYHTALTLQCQGTVRCSIALCTSKNKKKTAPITIFRHHQLLDGSWFQTC